VHRPPPSVGPQKQVILTSNSGIVLSKLLMMEVNDTLYSSHIVYSLSDLFTVGSGLNPSIQKASNYRNNTVLYE
jgi:hypothetical protein